MFLKKSVLSKCDRLVRNICFTYSYSRSKEIIFKSELADVAVPLKTTGGWFQEGAILLCYKNQCVAADRAVDRCLGGDLIQELNHDSYF